jgi:hypothetical protein
MVSGRRLIAVAAVLLTLTWVACGDDGDGGSGATGGANPADETKVEPVEEGVLGYINGNVDGTVKFPVLELWDIPGCTCDKLIANTPHGTRIKVLNKKPNCNGVPYEVELLDGEQKGARGWVLERFILLGDEPPGNEPFNPNPED